MKRRDWLLAFLVAEPAGGWRWHDGAKYWMDPVRLMKGLFLTQNEDESGNVSPLPEEPYDFYPYAYGPFTKQIYDDLDELLVIGLAERRPVPGKSYAQWRLTPRGREAAEDVLHTQLSRSVRQRIRRAKQIVVFTTFSDLLKYVYSRYPQYATESVMRGV